MRKSYQWSITLESQELALGTGSVIEKDGTFYAFYTAHNGRLVPKEMFMLSTSTDLENWTKQDFLIDPRGYGFNQFDFRDPHVVYVEEKGTILYVIYNQTPWQRCELVIWCQMTYSTGKKIGDGIFFLNNAILGQMQWIQT